MLQEIRENNYRGFPHGIVGFVDFMDLEVEKKIEDHLYSPNFRETGGTKTRGGKHINHPLINQQIHQLLQLL